MANENLYLQHEHAIEAVLKWICRDKRLSHDACDEFSSYAKLRLIEDDYAVLRKFRGESTIRTYLTTVLNFAFSDWRNHEQGKWRNSAAAKAVGPLAMEMEKLIGRDGLEYVDAVRILIARGLASSESECDEIRNQLKPRPPRRTVDPEVLETFSTTDIDPVDAEQRRRRSADVNRALAAAKRLLPDADQVLVKMRFESGFTVAKIAKVQGLDQKALYRRFERIVAQLRESLSSQGISDDDWDVYLPDWDANDDPNVGGSGGNGPSSLPNAGGAVA